MGGKWFHKASRLVPIIQNIFAFFNSAKCHSCCSSIFVCIFVQQPFRRTWFIPFAQSQIGFVTLLVLISFSKAAALATETQASEQQKWQWKWMWQHWSVISATLWLSKKSSNLQRRKWDERTGCGPPCWTVNEKHNSWRGKNCQISSLASHCLIWNKLLY